MSEPSGKERYVAPSRARARARALPAYIKNTQPSSARGVRGHVSLWAKKTRHHRLRARVPPPRSLSHKKRTTTTTTLNSKATYRGYISLLYTPSSRPHRLENDTHAQKKLRPPSAGVALHGIAKMGNTPLRLSTKKRQNKPQKKHTGYNMPYHFRPIANNRWAMNLKTERFSRHLCPRRYQTQNKKKHEKHRTRETKGTRYYKKKARQKTPVYTYVPKIHKPENILALYQTHAQK